MRARVFLASITDDGPLARGDIYFRELGETADHHTEQGLVSRGPIRGHRTAFTAAAERDRCVIEWLADTTSPLHGGARVARLAHGDSFVVRDVMFLAYVEVADRALGVQAEFERSRDDSIRAIDALSSTDLRDALGRFALLPYVARALYAAFVEQTGFVQHRDGRVPRVNEIAWERREAEQWLVIELAVWSAFSGEWSEPRTTVRQRLSSFDVDAIAECTELLRAIPPA